MTIWVTMDDLSGPFGSSSGPTNDNAPAGLTRKGVETSTFPDRGGG